MDGNVPCFNLFSDENQDWHLEDLDCALKNFQQDNYVQLYKRISMKLGTGSKYKNMEAAESAAGLLIY